MTDPWIAQIRAGKITGHALGVCAGCGERSMTPIEPPFASGPRKGQPRPTARSCPFCGGAVEPTPCSMLGVTPRRKPTMRRVVGGPAERLDRSAAHRPARSEPVPETEEPQP